MRPTARPAGPRPMGRLGRTEGRARGKAKKRKSVLRLLNTAGAGGGARLRFVDREGEERTRG